MSITAPVNKIIKFSCVDGPGNRTAIFLQGCNFDCKYCHNPETRKTCMGCGICVDKCPAGALSLSTAPGRPVVIYDIDKCCLCDTCIKVCPHDASPRIRNMTASEVFTEVMKQVPYIRGITVSGGECTLHPEFLTELFTLCREEGLTCFIDSNGTLDMAKYPDLMAVTDSVMLDIKAYPAGDHLHVTGCDNTQVLANAEYLAKAGKLFEVRTVVVPDLFDAMDTVSPVCDMLLPYMPIRYKLIKYRPMGVREQYSHYRTPSDEEMTALSDYLHSRGWEDAVIL